MAIETRNGKTVLTGRHAVALAALRAEAESEDLWTTFGAALFAALRPDVTDDDLKTRILELSRADQKRAPIPQILGVMGGDEVVPDEILDENGAAAVHVLRIAGGLIEAPKELAGHDETFFGAEGMGLIASHLLGARNESLDNWFAEEAGTLSAIEITSDPVLADAFARFRALGAESGASPGL